VSDTDWCQLAFVTALGLFADFEQLPRLYPVSMSRAVSALLILGVLFFFLGWILVFASGYGGNSSGGSETVWRAGGLMVYASVPTLIVAGLLRVVGLLRSARRGSPTAL
jgi:hypothetical protein